MSDTLSVNGTITRCHRRKPSYTATCYAKDATIIKEDQCNEEALSIHRSCTELNKQIKEMEAEQSRNIVPHTVQQQEALEPVETFVLTPPCNLGCVGSCISSTLRDSIKKGLSNVRIAASQFILNRYVVIKLNVLLPNVHTLHDLKMVELSNKSRAFLLFTQQRCGLDGIHSCTSHCPPS